MRFFALKSLKLKFMIPILFFTLLGFTAVSLAGYYVAGNIIAKDVEDITKNKALKLARYVDGKLGAWKSKIEVLSMTEVVKKLDYIAFRDSIEENKDYFKDYEMLFIADAAGFSRTNTSVRENIAETGYYQKAMRGETIIADPVISKASDKPIIVMAAPVKDESGKVIGVVGGTIELVKISDIINAESQGESGYAMMLNNRGLVIAHPDKEKVFKENLIQDSSTSLSSVAALMINGEGGTGSFEVDGVKKITAYASVESVGWPGWPIAVVMDYNEATEGIGRLGTLLFAIGIAVVLINSVIIGFLISSSIRPILKIAKTAREVASGNLQVNVDIKSRDEIGVLAANFNHMVDEMRGLIVDIKEMSAAVAASSEQMSGSGAEVSKVSNQVAAAMSDVAKGATEQATATEKSSAKISEMVAGLHRINTDMRTSEAMAEEAEETVGKGEKAVRHQEIKMKETRQVTYNVSNSIAVLSHKSAEIGQILQTVRGIAEQTNLLSLNAAIEAARAGEYGKGFAVVADQIRNLADQSKTSVVKIGELIKDVRAGIENAVDEMRMADTAVSEQENALSETVKAFEGISEAVTAIAGNIQAVYQASDGLNRNAREAEGAIREIASIAEETAAGTEEVAASSEEQTAIIQQISESAEDLSRLAGKLQKSIEGFKV